MALPGRLDLNIYRGDTKVVPLQLMEKEGEADPTPINLTGLTFLSQIRYREEGAVVATFAADVVDAGNGELTLTLSASDTANIENDGVWDVQSTDGGGVVRTWLRGDVCLAPDVSRMGV